EPKAFLMDEPLSNLDAKLRVQMRSEIAKLHQRLGTTTVYVTHDQTEAITMADRVAVLRSGVLQQAGSPQTLYEEPVNLFVAGFIGSPAMNLVRGRLALGNGKPEVTFGNHRIAVPDDVVKRRAGHLDGEGCEVILGIRPEDMEDASFLHQTPPDRLLDVTVGLAEPMGAETIVHFEVGTPPVQTQDVLDLAADLDRGADPAAAASLMSSGLSGAPSATFTARLNPRTSVRAGSPAQIAVDVERIYLFDPATGEALR
ncbi:MAG TPA: ABC transporter ATP-binding protein, partial [Actinomycetota bacterium]